MFLSVNIPVYNCEKYLRQCIESVLAQTFSDYELILADDGSTDASGAICDEYAARDARISVLHLQNGGAMAARERALAQNAGDYVFFMDGDDVIAPDLFKRLYDVCSAHHPDIAAFNFEMIGTESPVRNRNGFSEGLYTGRALERVRRSLIYDRRRRSFNYGGVIYSLWSKIFRRGFFAEQYRSVPPEITKGEDMAITAILTCAAKSVYFMDFYGYQYRILDGSIMNTFRENEIENYKAAYRFIALYAPSIDKNSIAVWMMYMFLNYCRSAADAAKSCAAFEGIINRNTDAEFFAILSSARLYLPKLREIRLMHLVKKRKFKALYRALEGER